MRGQPVDGDTTGTFDPGCGNVPKLCGADVELGNFILADEETSGEGTAMQAAVALLEEMPGRWYSQSKTTSCLPPYPGGYSWGNCAAWGKGIAPYGGEEWTNQPHWQKKFLPANGGCSYIDHSHLEICLPETLSAFHQVAAWHAMLRITRSALRRANSKLPDGNKILVLVNNSDGLSHSYGSHTNFLISRRCFQNIFQRKLHYMLFLATFLTSSIIFTGAGKVGSENGKPRVDFQIAQRADFYESLMGVQTTYNRPIVNSRDEAHCDESSMARLHVIFFDSTLCHVSSLLKIGVTQIVLAMMEQDQVLADLILQDPVLAIVTWSRDLDLRSRARLISGAQYSALEIQQAIFEKAKGFVHAGRADGIVPRAREILALWEDTLCRLEAGDLGGLTSRLDWVLKRRILERAMETHPGLGWDSPELKHLDHLYSSLDDGLYWLHEPGLVEKVVSDEAIEHFVHSPPNDTRAWLRAHILSRAPESIDSMDWDFIRIRFRSGQTLFSSFKTLEMDPLLTQQECEPLVDRLNSTEDGRESSDFR